MIFEKEWFTQNTKINFYPIVKFINNFKLYLLYFNVIESLYLSFHSVKRNHSKIIHQRIKELLKTNISLNVFEVVNELYKPFPLCKHFSGIEKIHNHTLSNGHRLEICFNRASIARMSSTLKICTATREDLVKTQKDGRMLRINIKDGKNIIANICVDVDRLLLKSECMHLKGFYILAYKHIYWDQILENKNIVKEIKYYLNNNLTIYEYKKKIT